MLLWNKPDCVSQVIKDGLGMSKLVTFAMCADIKGHSSFGEGY